MALHTYDDTLFRTNFPAFANTTTYPEATLQVYWNIAILYISPYDFQNLSGDTLQQALNLFVAHLAFTTPLVIQGENPAFDTAATIDKISVTTLPPPADSFWKFMLSSSPYGIQLLGLLRVVSVGGYITGGLPESSAIRKVAGIF